MRSSVAVVAASTVTILTIAGCSAQASNDDVDGDANSTTVTVVAQPEDGGKIITDSIGAATQSVDIPIYSIGGPEITAALTKAKANGVAIRIMVNGGYGSYAPSAIALQKTLTAAPGAGTAVINWSNNNFNITHQKSVIIDAADKNGRPIPADQLPSSAKAIVSTGNFADYGGPFWSARDFDMVTTDQNLIASIEEVFASDFSCPGPTVINPSGLTATDRLVWSNGSTGFTAPNTYPVAYTKPPWGPNVTDQGNARAAYLDVITNAAQGDILRFTNEELTDPGLVDALTHAATPTAAGGQGADVRIIMSLPKGYTPAKAASFAGTLGGIWQIVKAGGTAHMFTNNADDPTALYVHGKMVIRNSERAMAGSENAGYMSLGANRELGMNFTGDDREALDTLVQTFDIDWARGDKWVTIWNPQNVPTPPANVGQQALPPQANVDLRATGGFPTDTAQKCGPVLAQATSKSN